jgi:hypothetical protein
MGTHALMKVCSGRCVMLDAFIIEQLRQRDEESEREHERPALHLPMPVIEDDLIDDDEVDSESSRVVILDM